MIQPVNIALLCVCVQITSHFKITGAFMVMIKNLSKVFNIQSFSEHHAS